MTTTKQYLHTDVARVEDKILLIRDKRVMLDADLAELYGVSTKVFNQAVKRNARRFPDDFMFQLTSAEKLEVVTNCDHLARLKFAKSLPFAFTEHGAIQAANILNSEQAIDMGVYVVRAFVHLRKTIDLHKELAARVDELERKSELSQVQIAQIVDIVRKLMIPAEPKKGPIGFVTPSEK